MDRIRKELFRIYLPCFKIFQDGLQNGVCLRRVGKQADEMNIAVGVGGGDRDGLLAVRTRIN